MGGGAVWGWVSYDPELNLIYYGTGNAGVLECRYAAWRQQVVLHDLGARHPENGMRSGPIRKSFPTDSWTYDEIMENVLPDMPGKGKRGNC